jgi:hypothetical protein
MSASLIEALTCGDVRSLSVMNALPVLLEVEEDVLLAVEELVGPPLIHWPTAPFTLATVPPVGATRVAACRLFSAVFSAP